MTDEAIIFVPCGQRLRSVPGCSFLNVIHIVHPPILVHPLLPPRVTIQRNSAKEKKKRHGIKDKANGSLQTKSQFCYSAIMFIIFNNTVEVDGYLW